MQGEIETDLLVIGGGMGGLTAGAWAARAGATVLLVDKAPEVGGAAAMSEGYLWTAPRLEDLQWEDPDVSPQLGAALADHFLEGIEWVESLGIETGERLTGIYGFGHGHKVDIVEYLRRCGSAIEAGGGWVVPGASTEELLRDEAGAVVGASVRDRDGSPVTVRAKATTIATGGFQGDAGLRQRWIDEHADRLLVRSNPYSVGDGLRLGMAAGGSGTEGVRGFYGHLVASPLPGLEEKYFIDLAQLHSGYGLLLNAAGERFTDETLGDHRNNQAVLEESGSRAVLVGDEHVHATYVKRAYIPGMDVVDKLELARQAGCRVAVADSVEELGEAISAWGYDGGRGAETVAAYSRVAAAGAEGLDPPSARYHRPLDEPPYFGIEVQPTITFPYAGLAIDADARVLGADGEPVGGLHAAGVDAGGIYKRGYAGGLSRGLVFGIRAGMSALGKPSWGDSA